MAFPEMIGTGEIAEMLGLTRVYVTDRLTKRPDFPPPAIDLSRKIKRWRKADVEEWMEKQALKARKRHHK